MKLRYKRFQLEDIAAAALHDGAIICWEPGLGKTLAALSYAIVKQAKRCLLVVPGVLHRQFQETALAMFGLHITRVKTVAQFYALGLSHPYRKDEREAKMPRFYMTTYQELGYNGADEWLDTATDEGVRALRADRMKARVLDPQFEKHQKLIAKLRGQKFDPAPFFKGIGTENEHGIRCVWLPTLARVISHAEAIGGGFDCVVIDEGVRLQATDSHVSNGVRRLNPKYRLVLTGTPIKNRLESMFWLLWWACGGSPHPTARFPYEGTSEAREQFANQHLQHDRFLTREEELAAVKGIQRATEKVNGREAYYTKGGSIRYIGRSYKLEKRTARICNIHRLWKLIAPIIIRRRKDDCGEDIVPKIIKPIVVQPGTAQLEVYKLYINNPPYAGRANPRRALELRNRIGMQLNILRQAALCPESENLAQVILGAGVEGMRKSWTDANPKQAAVLALIADLVARGEQVIVGSPFRCFSEHLTSRLRQAFVRCVMLDGTVSPERRGAMAADFKAGRYSVLVAGQNAMGKATASNARRISSSPPSPGLSMKMPNSSTAFGGSTRRSR